MRWEDRYPILNHVQVHCQGCGAWVPYRKLEKDMHQSPYTSWLCAYHCPRCGHHIATSHGADPGYGVESSYFEERIVAAVVAGADWVRVVIAPLDMEEEWP
jgi:hypothetical protein